MERSRVTLEVPADIAIALETEGLCERLPRRRGHITQLVVDGAETTAVIISLLQGPDTVRSLARLVLTSGKRDTRRSVSIRGPEGEASINVVGDVAREDLVRFLEAGLFVRKPGDADEDTL